MRLLARRHVCLHVTSLPEENLPSIYYLKYRQFLMRLEKEAIGLLAQAT